MEYFLRFVVGGTIVLAFATFADVLRPKSFAGLFGAAPSVALATLAMAFLKHDTSYVAAEARSMAIGSIAFALLGFCTCQFIMRLNWSAWQAAATALAIWHLVAFGIEQILIGRPGI